ncbi:hypothetical protein LRD18_03470 [Halorhodospira halochloris]|nr:hypothetical protein [Halorhodospira halochloris]
MEVARSALSQAKLSEKQKNKCALLIGSSGSTLIDAESAWLERHQNQHFIPLNNPQGHGELADKIAAKLNLFGPRYYFGTACSSSSNALYYGAKLVASGRVPAALVLGMDWYNNLTVRGFDSLLLLDPECAKPFDVDRKGLTLGEGVAALVILPESSDNLNWRLLGGASVADHQSPTQTTAEQIAYVIDQALTNSDVTSKQITAVKAHGTATPNNDSAEGQGISQVFGTQHPPISSLKGAFGHTLGACGAVEAAALMACVDRGVWPKCKGLENSDPECLIKPCLESVSLPSGGAGKYLLNFFGFGGNNSALVMERRNVD